MGLLYLQALGLFLYENNFTSDCGPLLCHDSATGLFDDVLVDSFVDFAEELDAAPFVNDPIVELISHFLQHNLVLFLRVKVSQQVEKVSAAELELVRVIKERIEYLVERLA